MKHSMVKSISLVYSDTAIGSIKCSFTSLYKSSKALVWNVPNFKIQSIVLYSRKSILSTCNAKMKLLRSISHQFRSFFPLSIGSLVSADNRYVTRIFSVFCLYINLVRAYHVVRRICFLLS